MKSKFLKKTKQLIPNAIYLFKTSAPIGVVFQYVFFHKRLQKNTRKYRRNKDEFIRTVQDGEFRNDWFSWNIRYWRYIFDEYNLSNLDEMNILEIGSWEGLSALYFLKELPNARLTCVDTWQGSDEHNDTKESQNQKTGGEEIRFDKNLAAYQDRITKIKSSSLAYFAENSLRSSFDLIYVDGSHKADDVMVDALHSFERLKPGGILIFDDYLWRHYPRILDNPASAINCFLKMKKDHLQILVVGKQLILQKITGLQAG